MKPNRGVATCAVLLSVLLAACGTGAQVPVHEDDATFARSLADTAAQAAVAKPGARVCREMQVGIAERDWVRGVVAEADGRRVTIRIDQPGRFEHTLNGVKVASGAVVSDDATAWTPCL